MRTWLTLGLAAAATVAGGVCASAGGSAAAADCSKVAGREVVERLRLADPTVANPVGKVLCGAFAGRGSRAMVVVLRGPGNTGFVDWVVFRWTGGAWGFLMKQPAGASITAAGSDIRQTLPIYRPADSRCCPTGGSKTRIWHWNGARFVAGPWKQATNADATTGAYKYGYFKTVSRNIQCDYGHGGNAPGYVRCGIKSGLRPAPPGRGPGCRQIPWLTLGATGRTKTGSSVCPGEDETDSGPFTPEGVGSVLGYGKTWSGGGLSCAAAVAGLTCRNKSGHGFFLSRASWRAF